MYKSQIADGLVQNAIGSKQSDTASCLLSPFFLAPRACTGLMLTSKALEEARSIASLSLPLPFLRTSLSSTFQYIVITEPTMQLRFGETTTAGKEHVNGLSLLFPCDRVLDPSTHLTVACYAIALQAM